MTTRVGRGLCFQGTAEDVAAVLGPHVDGANFLGYPEKVVTTTQCTCMIWKVRALWRALHGLHDRFCFKNTQLNEAVIIIWNEKRETWPSKLSDEHKDVWVRSVTNRLRTALTRSNHAVCRRSTPPWLRDVLEVPALRPEDSAAAEQAAPSLSLIHI